MSADIVSEGLCSISLPIRAAQHLDKMCHQGWNVFAALPQCCSRTGKTSNIVEVAAKFPPPHISPDPGLLQPPAARPPGESAAAQALEFLFCSNASSCGLECGGMSPTRPGKSVPLVGQLETANLLRYGSSEGPFS